MPPEPQKRREERSRLSIPGRLASAIHMVGTPGKEVARFTSMSRRMPSGSNFSRSSSSLPWRIWRRSTVVSA